LFSRESLTGLSLLRSGAVATLTIEREHARSSIDQAAAAELERVVAGLSDGLDLVMVVETGAGRRFFCTGGARRMGPSSD
jgi:enoyl-CoA hydratase/carnithine racemase